MKFAGVVPGWMFKPFVLRFVFLTMCLTAFRFIYVNYEAQRPCEYEHGTNLCISTTKDAVSANNPSSSALLLRKADRLSFSKEQVQLQGDAATCILWTTKQWRQKVDEYFALFQNLMKKNLLKPGSKALCIGAREGQQVMALRENGVWDSVGVDLVPFPPLVVYGDIYKQPFPENLFDFEYSDAFDVEQSPVNFLSEIVRTLKPGGIAVLHAPCDLADNAIQSTRSSCNRGHLVTLFGTIKGMHVESFETARSRIEIIMKKLQNLGAIPVPKDFSIIDRQHFFGNCSFSHEKLQAIQNAEPLSTNEPRKPWITLKQNIKNIVYLPNMIDITHHKRHIYVDVGARNYGSSIGSWFKNKYPKQNKDFRIFAIEADKSFESGYRSRKDVTLLPYAAWIRNESLMFGDPRTGDPSFKGAGMGRIQPVVQSTGNSEDVKDCIHSKETYHSIKAVQGMDFTAWLLRTISPNDYTVMKMDVEGTEFDLLPKMFDSGAICLVDELFLECHYNRWQKCCPERTRKYKKTYSDCLQLFQNLRASGVLVHQWW